MTVEEAMDMNSDSEMGDDEPGRYNGQNDIDDEDPRQSVDTSPQETPIVPVLADNPLPAVQKMAALTSDPRRRRASEDQDLSNGWEPHTDGANGHGVWTPGS